MAGCWSHLRFAKTILTVSSTAVRPEGIPQTVRRPTVVVQPTRGWAALDFGELWKYRDLLMILAGRDVKLRYKQTGLGVAWVVMQPLIAALIFAVMFGRFAKMPSDGHPYILFVFAGVAIWNYFAAVLQRAGNSLITDARLITKVYFPRIAMPLASTFSALIDLAVSLGVLGVLMMLYGVHPTWRILTLPLFIGLAALTATGVSLWLSALNVRYRDFVHAMPFLIQVWMFASPVVYATTIVPQKWRLVYGLNPAVAFIEGTRWAVLGNSSLTPPMVGVATAFSALVFVGGAFFFRRVERGFADSV